jgi:hypothetical protein
MSNLAARVERLEQEQERELDAILGSLSDEDLEALICPTLQAMSDAELERIIGGYIPDGLELEPMSERGRAVLARLGWV